MLQTCKHDASRAGLRKLEPNNNIPEVFLTRKAKKKIFIHIICLHEGKKFFGKK